MKWFFAFLISINIAFAGQYDDAWDHVKQATYIQSGASSFVEDVEHYGLKKGKVIVSELGLTTEEKVLGGAWYIYKHRELPIPLGDTKLIVRQNGLGMEFHW